MITARGKPNKSARFLQIKGTHLAGFNTAKVSKTNDINLPQTEPPSSPQGTSQAINHVSTLDTHQICCDAANGTGREWSFNSEGKVQRTLQEFIDTCRHSLLKMGALDGIRTKNHPVKYPRRIWWVVVVNMPLGQVRFPFAGQLVLLAGGAVKWLVCLFEERMW